MTHAPELYRTVIAKHSKSFSLASTLLSPEVAARAHIVYAWCRRADDAVDTPSEETAEQAVSRLENELERLYAGEAFADPVLAGFQEVVQVTRIPPEYPRELLAGMRMDVGVQSYRSLEELLLYCYRVAGTVGLMMCHVFGVGDKLALRRAAHLGMGMQLTNIARDVVEDWQRGRCSVPCEFFAAQGALLPAIDSQKFPEAGRQLFRGPVARLLRLAEGYYQSGDAGVSYLDRRSAWAVRTARLVYSEIGQELARRDYDVLAGRAVVSKLRKLILVAKAFLQTLWPRALGFESSARAAPRLRAHELIFSDRRPALSVGRASLQPGFGPTALRYPDDVLPL